MTVTQHAALAKHAVHTVLDPKRFFLRSARILIERSSYFSINSSTNSFRFMKEFVKHFNSLLRLQDRRREKHHEHLFCILI